MLKKKTRLPPPTAELSKFDFIDFGSSKGGAIEFAKAKLGGKNGIGVDINPEKIEKMRASGYECFLGDITQLDIPDNTFRFTILSHILEHLPTKKHCLLALREAARISSDFIYIQGPFFEEDRWLKKHGLKFFWSDWTGHPMHFKARDLVSCLKQLKIQPSVIYGHKKIDDSSSPCIHPINSPIDQHSYEDHIHPPKPHIKFERQIYKEIISVVALRENAIIPVASSIRQDIEPIWPKDRDEKKTFHQKIRDVVFLR